MKKSVILAIFVATIPLSSFAQDDKEENGFFDTIVGTRIQECKSHFDIEPYFILAVGADQDERITADVVKSLENFSSTGRITVPTSKKKDTIAMSCATYAEGMMAGGIGSQIVSAFGNAIGSALGEAINKTVEGVGEALNQGITQGNNK